jgi:hypothetical protein
MMTPHDRLLTTLRHQEPDRIPTTARLWLDTRLKLRQHYGVDTDDALYDVMGIDNGAITVQPLTPVDWTPTPEYIQFCELIGYELHSQYSIYEEWGVQRKLGSKGKSVLRQFYFTLHPWESLTTPREIEDAIIPDLSAKGRFDQAKQVIKARKQTNVIWGGLGHILWTKGWELRGMMQLMKDLHTNPPMANAILDKLMEYNLEKADRLLELGCDGLSVSEDWGNNYSMFINPKLWRTYFKPRYKTLFQKAKQQGKYIFFHSDGNITPIVGDLVEIGVDSLNPIQPECMDQRAIKQQYGDKITIDTGLSNQHTLPFGTTDEVKQETLRAIKDLAPGGGFVYGTSHFALYDVPVENVITLYETLKDYGSYPIQIPN